MLRLFVKGQDDGAGRFFGLCLVSAEDNDRLLKRYSPMPERHVETSVVLVAERTGRE